MLQRTLVVCAATFFVIGCLQPRDGSDLPLGVTITSPLGTSYENGTVDFTLQHQGLPTQIMMLANGVPVGELDAPYSRFTWDSQLEPERSYMMTALAVDAEGAFAISPPVEVVVDRTPPFVTNFVPVNYSTDVALYEDIIAVFNEHVVAYSAVITTDTGSDVANTLELRLDEQSLLVKMQELPSPLPNGLSIDITCEDLAGNLRVPPSGGWQFDVPAAVDKGGIANVALHHSAIDGFGQMYVARYDGTDLIIAERNDEADTWDQIGGVVATASMDQVFVSVSPAADYLYASYRSGGTAFVLEYDGVNWVQLGGDLGAGLSLDHIDVTLNAANLPVLVTSDAGVINTQEWLGASWFNHFDTPGSGAALETVVAGSYPWVVFEDPSGIGITRYDADGAAGYWYDVGSGILGAAGAVAPQVFIDLNEVAHVAFRSSANGPIEVHRWDGMLWSQVGSPVGTNVVSGPGLGADDSENPILVWAEAGGGVEFARWNGTDWDVEPAGFATPDGDGRFVQLSNTGLGQFGMTWQDQSDMFAARVNTLE